MQLSIGAGRHFESPLKALGGGLGAVAMTINGRIFRADMHSALKFAITGAISLVTMLLFFTLAIVLNQAVRR